MTRDIPVRISSVFSTRLFPDAVHILPDAGRMLRRADDFTSMAVLAASHVMSPGDGGSGCCDRPVTGVFVGSVHGPLETNFRFLDGLLDDGEGNTSPTIFSHSVHNAAAGYISRLLDTRGPSITVTTRTWPFVEALRTALVMLRLGRMDKGIVVGAELASPLVEDAMSELAFEKSRHASSGIDTNVRRGAVAWMLEREDSGEDRGRGLYLDNVEVMEESCDAPFFLLRTGERWEFVSEGEKPVSGTGKGYPAEAVFSLTESVYYALNSYPVAGNEVAWTADARFGHAEINIYYE